MENTIVNNENIKTETGSLLIAFLNELRDRRIPHCYWKVSYYIRESLSGGKDYDLLVDESCASDVKNLLQKYSFIKVKPKPNSRYKYTENWLSYDPGSGDIAYIHLHYRLYTGRKYAGEQNLPWEQYCFESAGPDGETGLSVASTEMQTMIVFARLVFETSYYRIMKALLLSRILSNKYTRDLRLLLRDSDNQKLEELRSTLIGPGGSDLFENTSTIERWVKAADLLRIKIRFSRQFKRYRYFNSIFAVSRSLYFHTSLFLRSFLKTPSLRGGMRLNGGGAVIVFIGPDGAGKSTVSENVVNWLGENIDVRKMYLGKGTVVSRIINKIARLKWKILELRGYTKPAPRPVRESSRTNGAVRKQKDGKIRIYMRAFSSIALAVKRFRIVRKAFHSIRRGTVVVTDRYPTLNSGFFDGPSILLDSGERGFIKMLAGIELRIYKLLQNYNPHLVFRLSVPLDVAIRRKPDHDENVISDKINAFENIRFPESKEIDIDASEPLEKVMKKVKNKIWSYCTEHHP